MVLLVVCLAVAAIFATIQFCGARDLEGSRHLSSEQPVEHEMACGTFIASLSPDQRQELQERYESLKGAPQVIHGSIRVDGDLSAVRPINVHVEKSKPVGLGTVVAVTALTNDGQFAFDAIAPGVYTVFCFEREGNPGIWYKNVAVEQDKPLAPLDITMPSSVITVQVVNAVGRAVPGANVTVGKTDSPSGSNKNFFTFRNGVTDAQGWFEATRLADGRYVAMASVGSIQVAEIVEVKPDARANQTLRLSRR